MKLAKFAEELRVNRGLFTDARGRKLPIFVWQDLIRIDGFRKTIENEFTELSENQFVNLVKGSIKVPNYPKPKVISEEIPMPIALGVTEFYPNIDEGWASDALSGIRVHLYYYENE